MKHIETEDVAPGVRLIAFNRPEVRNAFDTTMYLQVTEALRTAPVTAKAVRDYSRVFFASASDEELDKQGRITIPLSLRDYAGLQRECVVIGANTRLEIWDAAAWTSYLEQQEDAFSDASEEVLPGVL